MQLWSSIFLGLAPSSTAQYTSLARMAGLSRAEQNTCACVWGWAGGVGGGQGL